MLYKLSQVWEDNPKRVKFIIKLLIGGIPTMVILLIWLLPVPGWAMTEQVTNGQMDTSIMGYKVSLTTLTISVSAFTGSWIFLIYIHVIFVLSKLRLSKKYNPGFIAFIINAIFVIVFAIAIGLIWWLPIPNWVSVLSEQSPQQSSEMILDYRYNITRLISNAIGAFLLAMLWVLEILVPSELIQTESRGFKRYVPGLFVATVLFVVITVIWQSPNLGNNIQKLDYTSLAITIVIFLPLLFLIFYESERGKKLKRALKGNHGLFSHVLLATVVFTAAIVLIWWLPILLNEEDIFGDQLNLTIAAVGAFSLAIVGIFNLSANNRRANTSERQQAQELFVNSIRNLGDEIEIIRIGAIHGLGQLAKDSPEIWHGRVAKILCDFIRSTTGKSDYQAKYENSPSVEITTALGVLAVSSKNTAPSVGLDLRDTYLVGVDLTGVNLTRAKFANANLKQARLTEADLTGANLAFAKMMGAHLRRAKLLLATLIGTDLSESNLSEVELRLANLVGANLSGANLIHTELEEADMQCVQLRGTVLGGTVLYGAKLEGSFNDQVGAEQPLEEIFRQRTNQKADLTGCIFEDHLTDLRDISSGVFTQDLLSRILKYFYLDEKPASEIRYQDRRPFRRQPTQEDKERLVGNENVGKCKWGEFLEFEE